MGKWDKISLYIYQRIDAINKAEGMSEIDKVLFSTCAVFDLTEYQLDNMDINKASRLINRMTFIFGSTFQPRPRKRIGRYFINYDPASMTLGQYIELSFFLQSHIQNAHYVIASISNLLMRKNNANDHRKKAEYFLYRPVSEIMGSMSLFIERFTAFNNEYKSLFGLDHETAGDIQSDKFNKRYGWIYSASQVAEYERVTLEQAFGLPVRQAFNDLAYLKAKGIYEAEQLKRNHNVR